MKKVLAYALASVLLLSCLLACSRSGRIIPRSTMSRIYAEMFLADQWLKTHPEARRTADTTFFYEPIFEKFGYSFEDYNATVEKYITDPEKFAKIVKETSDILKARHNELLRLKDLEEGIKKANEAIKGYERRDFSTDSARWVCSSILWGVTDTLASAESIRPKLDSIALRDSIAVRDSLQALESLSALDSLRLDSLLVILAAQADTLAPEAEKVAGEVLDILPQKDNPLPASIRKH